MRRPLIILYRHRQTSTHHPLPPQTRRPLIVLYRHRRDVHSSSSTATDETSTHRPLPPQTRRPLIVLYRRRRDVHSSRHAASFCQPGGVTSLHGQAARGVLRSLGAELSALGSSGRNGAVLEVLSGTELAWRTWRGTELAWRPWS
ncbi:hypothetical protein HF521_016827 [Silurus meridionalis]|uniref:Uncharacterized protein n=1 Tax=Silurus meridionalis TaxID=175797 RepID=A0A8T0BWX0_SILME|nr:hypothetical protein HF521_016827 [Silurus meridionalis]